MNNPTIDKYGNKWWFNKKRQYHRLNGPAIENKNRYKIWYLNGKLHRFDGPAVERSAGNNEWWLDGRRHTQEQYFKELEKCVSKEEIFILRLKYS